MNEICARLLLNEQGQATQILEKVPCDPETITITSYPNWLIIGGILIAIIFVWFVFIHPIWRVWAQKKVGEAELQQAYKEQKIQIAEAEARKGAANLNKDAAIIEAEAVSEQIKRIGIQLSTHDLYLKWQWIKMMEDRPENSVIYVPTEAGLPILEAGKRKKIIRKQEEE